ncbi:MAG: hypothetical protein ABH877_03765, partial [bacterium]
MRARIVAAVIFASVALSAQEPSQPPIPSRGNQSEQQQQLTSQGDERTQAPTQQGAANVAVTIELPGSQAQANDQTTESEREDEGSPSNWWAGVSAIAAMVQAGFAGLLILLTFSLVLVSWSQWKTARTQSKILA